MTLSGSALALGMGVGPAAALPVTFTWNPAGTTPALHTSGAFTANNFTGVQYGLITLPAPVAGTYTGITNVGVLTINDFQLNGPSVSHPGLESSYSLYVTFSGTVNAITAGPGLITGAFTSLTYTLRGDPATTAVNVYSNIANTPTVTDPDGDDITLASGSLASFGANSAIIQVFNATTVVAFASAAASFLPNLLQSGFFVAPANYSNVLIESSFSATPLQITRPAANKFLITAGSFSADLIKTDVPEPATLSLFGLGALGIGLSRRRRGSKKA